MIKKYDKIKNREGGFNGKLFVSFYLMDDCRHGNYGNVSMVKTKKMALCFVLWSSNVDDSDGNGLVFTRKRLSRTDRICLFSCPTGTSRSWGLSYFDFELIFIGNEFIHTLIFISKEGTKMNWSDSWDQAKYQEFLSYLRDQKDESYRQFNAKIVQSKKEMLGIRVPILRKIAKEIAKGDSLSYLNVCQNHYYEEVLLEGLVIAQLKEDAIAYPYFEKFLPKIDNWAICDMVVSSMKRVKKNKGIYEVRIQKWLKDPHPFTVRIGLILLLSYYIEETYLTNIFALVEQIDRKEYYIQMGIAWLLSVCFVKFPDETTLYFDQNQLDPWIYQKTLQKIIESNRVDSYRKEKIRQRKKASMINS